MNSAQINTLLERLRNCDPKAIEEIFLAYEPYLRMMVRRHLPRQLRAEFDSTDIVQSIWAELLRSSREAGWRFTDANHLTSFLIKMARNRIIDGVRLHRSTFERGLPLSSVEQERVPASPLPRPNEIVEADELWQQLQAICPPAHRDLLELRRQGNSLDEIAAKTGMHKSSVRRIFYDLSTRLTASQPVST
jgi:RNA polymerase sigma-70 factor (ECF subfamily)